MRTLLLKTTLLLMVLTSGVHALDVSKEEKVKLTQQVHAIFSAKCADCHGPELPRPKGKFGYVLDLHRVGTNPDYVVPGNAEESEIYQMVLHNDMPGEESDIAALTPEEVDAVKRWINVGAPGELVSTDLSGAKPAQAVMAALPPSSGGSSGGPASPSSTAAAPKQEKADGPFLKAVVRWVGKLHPVSTHFPVALMFAALLAEGIGWFTKRDSWLQTVRFLVVIAALGGLSATVLGWINAYFSSYDKSPGALLWWHRWLGTGTALWAVVCAAAAFMGECREGSKERNTFRVALVVGATLVGISGFLGSALIYGLDHYAWK